jgi:hypothetical protein
MDPNRAIKIYLNDTTQLRFITTVFSAGEAMLVKERLKKEKKCRLVFKSVNNKTLMCFDHMGNLDKGSYRRATRKENTCQNQYL